MEDPLIESLTAGLREAGVPDPGAAPRLLEACKLLAVRAPALNFLAQLREDAEQLEQLLGAYDSSTVDELWQWLRERTNPEPLMRDVGAQAIYVLTSMSQPPPGTRPVASQDADSLLTLGLAAYQLDLMAARALVDQAMGIYKRTGDRVAEAAALILVGDLAARSGDADSAVKATSAALELFNEIGDLRGQGHALHELGILSMHADEPDAALALLTEALSLQQQVGDRAGQADTTYQLGMLALHEDDLAKATRHLNSALSLFRELELPVGVANALFGLGVLGQQSGDAAAEDHLLKALNLYREIGDGLGEGNTLLTLGEMAIGRAEIEAASERLIQASRLFRNVGHLPGEAAAHQRLGQLAHSSCDWATAAERFGIALSINRSLHDWIAVATSLEQLGTVDDLAGNESAAISRFEEALQLYQQYEHRLGEASVLNKLGTLYSSQGEIDPGTQMLERALSLFRQERDVLGEASTLAELGTLFRLRSNWDASAETVGAALRLYEQIGDQLGQANCLHSLGLLAMQMGDRSSARESFETALRLQRQNRNRLGEANTLRGLGVLARLTGNVRNASEHLKAALNLYRELKNDRGQARIQLELGTLAMLRDPALAFETLSSAAELYRQIGDPWGEAHTLLEMSQLSSISGDAKSIEWLSTARRLFQAVGHRPGEAGALLQLGRLLRREGDRAGAERHALEALNLCQASGEMRGQAGSCLDLGGLALSEGDLPRAAEYLNRALAHYVGLSEPLGQAHAQVMLGDLALRYGESRSAALRFDTARRLYSQIGDVFEVVVTGERLARVLLDLDDPGSALAVLVRVLEAARGLDGYVRSSGARKALVMALTSTRLQALTLAAELPDGPQVVAAILEGGHSQMLAGLAAAALTGVEIDGADSLAEDLAGLLGRLQELYDARGAGIRDLSSAILEQAYDHDVNAAVGSLQVLDREITYVASLLSTTAEQFSTTLRDLLLQIVPSPVELPAIRMVANDAHGDVATAGRQHDDPPGAQAFAGAGLPRLEPAVLSWLADRAVVLVQVGCPAGAGVDAPVFTVWTAPDGPPRLHSAAFTTRTAAYLSALTTATNHRVDDSDADIGAMRETAAPSSGGLAEGEGGDTCDLSSDRSARRPADTIYDRPSPLPSTWLGRVLLDNHPNLLRELTSTLLPQDLLDYLTAITLAAAGGLPPRVLLVPDQALWNVPWAGLPLPELREGDGASGSTVHADTVRYMTDIARLAQIPSLALLRVGETAGSPQAASDTQDFNPNRRDAAEASTHASNDDQRVLARMHAVHGLADEQAALSAAFGDCVHYAQDGHELKVRLRAESWSWLVLSVHGQETAGWAHHVSIGDGDSLTAADLLTTRGIGAIVAGACWFARLSPDTAVDPIGLCSIALARHTRTIIAGIYPLPDGSIGESSPTALMLAHLYAQLVETDPVTALHNSRQSHRMWPPSMWAGLSAITTTF